MSIRRKWRPSLALVVALVCTFLVTMPVIGALAARLTSNQFVRETERSLLAQGALLAEAYAMDFASANPKTVLGNPLAPAQRDRRARAYHPTDPVLSVFRDPVQPPRPDGRIAQQSPGRAHARIAGRLDTLVNTAQKSTLAAYLVLDHHGQAIASSGEEKRNFAHIPEVAAALRGETRSALRARGDLRNRHPLASISRDTSYRVYVAMPAIVENRVVGAVYLSRTPLDLQKYLYRERAGLTLIAALTACGAIVVGVLFWRLITSPVRALMLQSRAVANGSKPAPEPLNHYGLREIASLGESVLSMARTLTERGQTIESYTAHVTHEMKSPVTAIMGAAELLAADQGTMAQERRAKLHANIAHEAVRMNTLLERLRELARTKALPGGSAPAQLETLATRLRGDFPTLTLTLQADSHASLPLPAEQAYIALSQMLQNALQHGADQVNLLHDGDTARLQIQDNGRGISPGNCDKVLTPFFTTRRETGGTGVGLSIVQAILERHNGLLRIRPSKDGALFEICFDQKPARHG